MFKPPFVRKRQGFSNPYIKVRGIWKYLYRAVDRGGKTLDFMLSEPRNTTAATLFFAKALSNNGIPLRIVIDRSGPNGAGIKEAKKILKRYGCPTKISGQIEVSEQHNCARSPFHQTANPPNAGIQVVHSAPATLDGIEVAQMIRKKQFSSEASGFGQFAELAG